ncbi:MAG: hypothetical protein U1F68_15210 [Gammaproteobacteria bacterium]
MATSTSASVPLPETRRWMEVENSAVWCGSSLQQAVEEFRADVVRQRERNILELGMARALRLILLADVELAYH